MQQGDFRTGDISVSPIKLMELRAAKHSHVISLAQGIPSFDTPECIKKAAIEAIQKGKAAKYSLTPGLPELREVIAEELKHEGMHYDYETEIIATCGSIEGITATLLAILNPGEEVIIPSPVYASYAQAVRVAHGVPVFVPLNEEKGWAVDIEEFEKRITPKTRVIFYCNPSNPTGTIYTKEQLLTLAEIAEKHNLFLLSDEVYKDFVYEGDGKIFSLASVERYKHRVIRVFSFSKAFAMTGWRIGFVHSSRENIQEILKIHDSSVTCAPVVSQYAAIAAMTQGKEAIEKFRRSYEKRLLMTVRFLDSLPDIFSYVRPNASYFVFPKIFPKAEDKKMQNADIFCDMMLEKTKIAMVPGGAFGPTGEGHVRISFGRDEKDLHEAFSRMYTFFRNFSFPSL